MIAPSETSLAPVRVISEAGSPFGLPKWSLKVVLSTKTPSLLASSATASAPFIYMGIPNWEPGPQVWAIAYPDAPRANPKAAAAAVVKADCESDIAFLLALRALMKPTWLLSASSHARQNKAKP